MTPDMLRAAGRPNLGIACNSDRPDPDIEGFARAAEAAGFDSLWVNENVHADVPHLDPFVALAVIAASTESIRVGTAAALLPLRHPVELARTAASLDVVSRGRLILGVAAGGGAPEGFAAYGVPVRERGPRSEEALALIRRLWTGEPVTWESSLHRLDGYTIGTVPVQPGGPPIWLGGFADSVLRRAARWADGVLPIRRTPAQCGELYARVGRYARECGRDAAEITRAVYVYVCLDATGGAARRTAKSVLEARYRYPVEFLQPGATAALGTAEDCVSMLQEFAAAGAEHIVLDLACPDERKHEQLEALEGLVLPAIRS